MNFVTAYLNGSIDGDDIFVEQSLAYEVDINIICVLNGTPIDRYALPALVYSTSAWPVYPTPSMYANISAG